MTDDNQDDPKDKRRRRGVFHPKWPMLPVGLRDFRTGKMRTIFPLDPPESYEKGYWRLPNDFEPWNDDNFEFVYVHDWPPLE